MALVGLRKLIQLVLQHIREWFWPIHCEAVDAGRVVVKPSPWMNKMIGGRWIEGVIGDVSIE
jgi:hypothetical protein